MFIKFLQCTSKCLKSGLPIWKLCRVECVRLLIFETTHHAHTHTHTFSFIPDKFTSLYIKWLCVWHFKSFLFLCKRKCLFIWYDWMAVILLLISKLYTLQKFYQSYQCFHLQMNLRNYLCILLNTCVKYMQMYILHYVRRYRRWNKKFINLTY